MLLSRLACSRGSDASFLRKEIKTRPRRAPPVISYVDGRERRTRQDARRDSPRCRALPAHGADLNCSAARGGSALLCCADRAPARTALSRRRGEGPAPQPVPSCALPIKKRPAGRLTPYERGSTPRGRNLFEGVYHTRMEKYSFFCRIPASGGKEGNPACSIRRNRLGTAASGEEQSFFI